MLGSTIIVYGLVVGLPACLVIFALVARYNAKKKIPQV